MTEQPRVSETTVEALARRHWDEDRAILRETNPAWEMPAWSRAPAWRRRPYITAAREGKRPE